MDVQRQRQVFEDRAYREYVARCQQVGREAFSQAAYFALTPDGDYVEASLNAAWWGWRASQTVVDPAETARRAAIFSAEYAALCARHGARLELSDQGQCVVRFESGEDVLPAGISLLQMPVASDETVPVVAVRRLITELDDLARSAQQNANDLLREGWMREKSQGTANGYGYAMERLRNMLGIRSGR